MRILNPPIHAIIFDFGGTIDTNGMHWAKLFWRAYSHEFIPISYAQFWQAYIYAERQLEEGVDAEMSLFPLLQLKVELQLHHLVAQGHLSPLLLVRGSAIAHYCHSYVMHMVVHCKGVLAQLSTRYPLVLVSNYYGNIHCILSQLGVSRYFTHVVDSARLGIRKPNPQIFLHALKVLHYPQKEVLVVGDSYSNDIVPAQSLGCQTIRLHRSLRVVGDEVARNTSPHTLTITDIEQLITHYEL